MSAMSVEVPYPVFTDRDGEPLENGYVWVGVANQNPQTNPIQVYFDKALTQPAAQPLRTIAGYVSKAGTPAQLYVDTYNYSILAQDKNGTMVYNFADATGVGPNAAGVDFVGVKGQVGNLQDIADADGSDWIGFQSSGSTSVIRSVQDKLREIISVKDFGAVGDGVTDDAAAIQAAVNAAGNNVTVYFPSGIYAVGSSGINVANKTGVTLFGDGAVIKFTALSVLTTPGLGRTTIRLVSCVQSGVQGLEFNGNNFANAAVGFNACTECFVDKIVSYLCGDIANITSINGGLRNRFTNNLIYSGIGSSRGIWVGNVTSLINMETDVYIHGNTVRNMPATGFGLHCFGGRISNNYLVSCNGAGMAISGFNGLTSRDLTIVGNYCLKNNFQGIQSDVVYSTDADLTRNITVVGNVCNENNNSGIYAVNTLNWTVAGNVCSDNKVGGITASIRARNITIANNVCNDTRSGLSRTQVYGIQLAGSQTSYGASVTGNTCSNHLEHGIDLRNIAPATFKNFSIVGNNCYLNSSSGILATEVNEGDITNGVVSGNVCENNTVSDIRLSVRDVVIGANRYVTQGFGTLTSWPLASNNATPSVPGRAFWIANNSSATSITNFVSGVAGQQITIRAANGNTTIVHGATIVNKGAINVTIPANGIITYVLQGTVWYEVSRSF